MLLETAGFAAIASQSVIASSTGNLFFGEDYSEYSEYPFSREQRNMVLCL